MDAHRAALQPVTRGALEAIRGVNCDGAIDTLRKDVNDLAGRAELAGAPQRNRGFFG